MKFVIALITVLLNLTLLSPAQADGIDGVDVNSDRTFAALPDRCEAGSKCQILSYGRERPTVIAWGDSHMAQQLPGLIASAKAKQVNLVAFVQGFCPPIFRGTDSCATFGRSALDQVEIVKNRANAGPVTVVLGGYWDYYLTTTEDTNPARAPRSARLRADAPLLFEKLSDLHVRVAAIATVPTIWDESACTLQSQMCERSAMLPYEAFGLRWLNARLDQVNRSRLITTNNYLCDSAQCHVNVGDTRVYDDNVHLSLDITRRFTPAFAWTTG